MKNVKGRRKRGKESKEKKKHRGRGKGKRGRKNKRRKSEGKTNLKQNEKFFNKLVHLNSYTFIDVSGQKKSPRQNRLKELKNIALIIYLFPL